MKFSYKFLDSTEEFGIYRVDTRRMETQIYDGELPCQFQIQKSRTKEEMILFMENMENLREIDITFRGLSLYSQSFWPLKYMYVIKSGDNYLVYDRYWKSVEINAS